MNFKIELHPDAALELQDAYQWYEDRSAGLGNQFLTLLNFKIKLVTHLKVLIINVKVKMCWLSINCT